MLQFLVLQPFWLASRVCCSFICVVSLLQTSSPASGIMPSPASGSKSKRICCFELSEQEVEGENVKFALGLPEVRKSADEKAHEEAINNRASFLGVIDYLWRHPGDCGAAEKWAQRRGEGSGMMD